MAKPSLGVTTHHVNVLYSRFDLTVSNAYHEQEDELRWQLKIGLRIGNAHILEVFHISSS